VNRATEFPNPPNPGFKPSINTFSVNSNNSNIAELERCFGGPSVAGTPTATHAAATVGVLSLDRRDGQRLDAAGCWDAPSLWPRRVIVMTLERVGSDAGPDLDTLAAVRRRSPGTVVVGAGGIRNERDLARAHDAGAEAWLVASALHDGRLPRVRA
jgi:phosphoribosylformimino-5-aminoimidazole carboxamide ribotide isomerase